MGCFLEPGETYQIEIPNGNLICKALSFREQRKVIKSIKELSQNQDPERAMDLVAEVIATAAIGWDRSEVFSVDALLDAISFQQAMAISKEITEGGKLNEAERKK